MRTTVIFTHKFLPANRTDCFFGLNVHFTFAMNLAVFCSGYQCQIFNVILTPVPVTIGIFFIMMNHVTFRDFTAIVIFHNLSVQSFPKAIVTVLFAFSINFTIKFLMSLINNFNAQIRFVYFRCS